MSKTWTFGMINKPWQSLREVRFFKNVVYTNTLELKKKDISLSLDHDKLMFKDLCVPKLDEHK